MRRVEDKREIVVIFKIIVNYIRTGFINYILSIEKVMVKDYLLVIEMISAIFLF